jgi:hypothetical protein
MIYWRAFKMAWNTFFHVLRHERAHETWAQTYNAAIDMRVNAEIAMYMKYPCVMHDDESGRYFVAGSTGPVSWRYHRYWWQALLELWTRKD